jgi:hypothetical protein
VAVFDQLADAVKANDEAAVAMLLAIEDVIDDTPPARVLDALRRLPRTPPPPPVPITDGLRDFAVFWSEGCLPSYATDPNA